jgi:hypothetical protein
VGDGVVSGLGELLERVRSAKGPDRKVDALIEVEVRRQEAYRVGLNDQQRAYWTATVDGLVYDSATRYDAPRLSASIDAALALVERVLPGWRYDIHSPRFGRQFEGVLMDGDHASRRIDVATATTAPLAILAALLSALIAQEPK